MLVLQQIDGLSCCWVHSHHTTKSAAAKFLVTLLGPHRCSSSCSSVQPVTQALQYIVYIYIYSQFCTIFVWLVGFIPTPAYRKIFPLSLPPKEKKPRWKQQFSSVSSSSVSKFGEAAMADDSSTNMPSTSSGSKELLLPNEMKYDRGAASSTHRYSTSSQWRPYQQQQPRRLYCSVCSPPSSVVLQYSTLCSFSSSGLRARPRRLLACPASSKH